MALALHFLGPPQLIFENQPVSVNRRTIVALLAYLAVNDEKQAGQKHTREYLSALLWPDYDQDKAFTNLRHTVWEIQHRLGQSCLSATRETLCLNSKADIWVDVHRFEALILEGGAQADINLRVPLLNEAVKLYRNHFLTGFSLKDSAAFTEWAFAEYEDLQHKLAHTLTALSNDYCALGLADNAIPCARRLVALNPLNESAHRLLMEIYLQADQHNAALKQYQTCEQILRKELGIDPHPETRALYKQIRKGELKPAHVAKPIEPDLPKNNLPLQLTSFIGREKEQVAIVSLIANHRLITLLGAGGIGKTRLSLQIAAEVLGHYPDGVWFIDLAPLTNPELIPQTILAALRLGELAGLTPLKVLEDQLHNRKLLLILDNCEHLVEASAEVAHALLMSAPAIDILATSREALGVKGELTWHVPSLALPDLKSLPELEQLTQYESVRLFIERALLVQPYFSVDQTNASIIAQICIRLDGIPLAIELAAARVKVLSVDQIHARLDDCFRLLTGGSRTVLERHQTLRTVVDWSYNLLPTDEKNLLCQLSVFMGGWTIEAAEQVCLKLAGDGDVLDLLTHLVDKSWVVVDGSASAARYHLLETTRQYGREKLLETNETELWRNRHLAYFVDLADKGFREITGPRQAEVLDLLDAELDNFRAALEWSVSKHDIEPALRILGALGWSWDMRGYYNEYRAWYEKICMLGDRANYPHAYAHVLNHIAHFASGFDHRPEARSLLEESRAIWLKLGSAGEQGLADVLLFLGMDFEINDGNLDEAESFYKQSLELSQRCGNQRMHAASLMFLARIESARGNMAAALNLYEQSLAYAQHIGDLLIISLASGNLSGLFIEQKCYEKARPLIDQNLKINEELHFRVGLAEGLIGSGDLYRHQGDYIQAEQCFEKSISVSRDLGMKGHVSFTLYLLAMLALHRNDYSSATLRFSQYIDFSRALEEKVSLFRLLTGMSAVAGGTHQPERCAKLFGAVQAIFSAPDFQMHPFNRAEFERHIQIARDQLGDATFDALSDEGGRISLDEAVALALSE